MLLRNGKRKLKYPPKFSTRCLARESHRRTRWETKDSQDPETTSSLARPLLYCRGTHTRPPPPMKRIPIRDVISAGSIPRSHATEPIQKNKIGLFCPVSFLQDPMASSHGQISVRNMVLVLRYHARIF